MGRCRRTARHALGPRHTTRHVHPRPRDCDCAARTEDLDPHRSNADRVPDGLQLEERRDLVEALRVGLPWTTRFTLSAAARSSSARPSVRLAPVRSIALTSMCEASHGASSVRWPVRMLTTPPGSRSSRAPRRARPRRADSASDASATTALPPTSAGAIRETRPSSGGSSARRRDDAGRLRHREVEVRARDRVRPTEHLRQLVGEPGVPDPTIDRPLDLVARP